MANWIATARLTLCIVLAAGTLGSALPSPARADEHGRDGWEEHGHDGWREHGHDRWREHTGDRWREYDRYDDYRHRPDVYYSAPPVIVAPRGYYVQPGATLNFNLPFFR
jgi:hypothetical protein